jgi:acetyltransferase-like isoleucine patch superfamily enzyme
MSRPSDPLHKALCAFYDERAKEFRNRFKRLVSFGDMVTDRWEKARILGFGTRSSVYDSALVMGDVTVGENTWIGPQVILDGAGAPLRIGDYCNVSCGVQIYTHDSVKWSITGGQAAYEYAPVTVGSCVYIGPNTIITKNVTIGSHVIIGAQSLVNSSLPDFAVAWGQPAKIVGHVAFGDKKDDCSIEYY